MEKVFVIISLLLLFTTKSIFASGFNISKIGNLDTAGAPVSHWWYTGSNPTLSGTGLPDTDVTIEIDGASSTVHTDSSGDWSSPTTMGEGDHTVKLTNAATSLNFTLTLGANNVNWEAASKSAPNLPAAGTPNITILISVSGLALSLIGGKLLFGRS